MSQGILPIIYIKLSQYIAYTGTVYQDLSTALDNTHDGKMYDLNNKARNTLKSDYHQNRKINVFFLCCKNTVNWRKEIRPISSYAGHLFHHEKYTLALCTSVMYLLE